MIRKVLVANRGEIAVRIIRACQELGIRTVAAYSTADRDSLAVRLADEAVCIGPPPPAKSYLNAPALISAALVSGCDAIHPGYGFLSENPYFAEMCADCKLTFIGPPPEPIRLMGDKAIGRETMRKAGVPTVPGSDGEVRSLEEAIDIARQIGYPVLLKPSGGGGGRGMRVAYDEADLQRAFSTARAEAEAAFGNGALLLEKYLTRVRHVEIQVLADQYGNAIHLGERDCSAQRRHQKIVEEAPSPAVTPELRARMGADAVRGITAIGYVNAGTLEFLLDEDGNYYFIEMNTRIQVEHPVTEQVTGVDLVRWQLLIASGERLTLRQEDIKITRHAIECRINAEDPERDFLPASGEVEFYLPPGGPGVRVDSHLYPGYKPPGNYDSLLAKIITVGDTREEALNRMRRALHECVITGIKTTIPFQLALIDDPEFRAGRIHTGYVAELLRQWKETLNPA
ncbi:acetyl-CoA carboxylase biotin carboxylase subunit [Chloroflexus sp. MS-CIW-1]|jgi:acetyl-CoA carboxylase biotin carboxylase subunit|uniref:acetyl-CoA carboxylase biotin carboxylase subunit n=1 Tax=unclassified Chloroflexus TaxID=2633855 RepID=UPI0004DFBD9A|nr:MULTISPECIES: acetyl-CoA carboxylase biotin carboxylase subunit [unclassified Chloroflexus]MBO9349025.1 acetyl-CoA carboxylase biotin carboxylase subunit [Chloroflexus sp.]MDN5272453.1 acetyl-CoA carboxylase biotin carboxylase subunit [Chloroflexus sp. MS-CIW-1]